jgi:hypothetical protein
MSAPERRNNNQEQDRKINFDDEIRMKVSSLYDSQHNASESTQAARKTITGVGTLALLTVCGALGYGFYQLVRGDRRAAAALGNRVVAQGSALILIGSMFAAYNSWEHFTDSGKKRK